MARRCVIPVLLLTGAVLWLLFRGPALSEPLDPPVQYTYRVLNVYPHDPQAFTQGLVLEDDHFYEGTGQFSQSSLRRVNRETGEVEKIRLLPDQYFGEGIVLWQDRIIQITWRGGTGFVYDKNSFRSIKEFYYPGEGWGLTQDGRHLIMSDGTSFLRELDPETFDEVRRYEITDQGAPLGELNELEYVDGRILANVWHQDRVAVIDPEKGRVTGWLDLSGLRGKLDPSSPADVLNGIAFDPETGHLWVTGKYWPQIFEIEMIPAEHGDSPREKWNFRGVTTH